MQVRTCLCKTNLSLAYVESEKGARWDPKERTTISSRDDMGPYFHDQDWEEVFRTFYGPYDKSLCPIAPTY